MIAVGDKNAHSCIAQAQAAIAKAQLGFDAAIFFIIHIASQHEKIGFFCFAQAKKPIQRFEGGFMQQLGQMAAPERFRAKVREKGYPDADRLRGYNVQRPCVASRGMGNE